MSADFFLLLPILIFSIVVHEVAHAWQARREGDDTAERLGRITLNPIPHLDPMGSVIVPLLLYFSGANILFGWARPVPVDPSKYRHYVAGDIRVSLAGIVSNLGLALIFLAVAVAVTALGSAGVGLGQVGSTVREAAFLYGVYLNLILAFFNLIPIPPLDGSHVLYHALPRQLRTAYRQFGRFGMLVLFALLLFFPGVFSVLLAPVSYLMGAAGALIRLWV